MLWARSKSRRSKAPGFNSLLEYSCFSSCGSEDLMGRRGGRGTFVKLMLCELVSFYISTLAASFVSAAKIGASLISQLESTTQALIHA